MAVRIRLARYGAKKQPFYRVVVSDKEKPRDGCFLEIIGTYDPRKPDNKMTVDQERLSYWVKNGAKPTKIVSDMLTSK